MHHLLAAIVGLVLCGLAVLSGRSWNGWDLGVHDDRGIGVQARWVRRALLASLGASLTVAAAGVPARSADVIGLVASWVLCAGTAFLSRGVLWRRSPVSEGGVTRAWEEGTLARLRVSELTRRGRVYAATLGGSMLASVLVALAAFNGSGQ